MSDYDGPESIQNIITDHSCKHEADLAVMANNIKQILATLRATMQEYYEGMENL